MARVRFCSIAALAGIFLAATARGKRIDVHPGPGTPVQDAIDGAAPGDTIQLHNGVYPEALAIDKSLRLIGRYAFLDGGCTSPSAIEVGADHVTLSLFTVAGGATYTVHVANRDHVRLRALGLNGYDLADEPTCGAAQFGVHVSASTNVRVERSSSFGYQDTDVFIDDVQPNARVRVFENQIGGRAGDPHGIVVANSSDTPDGSYAVLVGRNNVENGGTGILLTNADGIVVFENHVGDTNTVVGIDVNASSDHNLIVGNVISTGGTDVRDAGSGNCWRSNTYTTGSVPPCP